MRILLASSKPFLPQLDGGNVASLRLFETLNKQCEHVDYCTLYSEKHPIDIQLFDNNNIRLVGSFKIRLTPSIFGGIKSLLIGKSYILNRFVSLEFNNYLIKNQSNYDVIILDGLFSTLPLSNAQFNHKNIWLRSHNLEHEIWQQHSAKSKNVFSKWYFKLLSQQLLNYTKQLMPKLKGVLMISELEAPFYKSISARKTLYLPFIAIPNAVSLIAEPRYFHFGAMNWHPNIESANVFIDQFVPSILDQLPYAKFQIAGAFFETYKKVIPNTILNNGYVLDSKQFIQNAGILIAPIQSGSGVRIKILEALSEGVIVLTTSIGAQGIKETEFPNLFIENDWKSFIEIAIQLGTDKSIRKNINIEITSRIGLISTDLDLVKLLTDE
jgi:glycosyltransferase involved in cell wall biosynthesis